MTISTLRALACALLLCITAVSANAAPARPIDQLGWLVGGVWSADASKLGGGMQHIDTRYEWAPNNAFIRFTTTFVSAQGSLLNYAGNLFAPNPGNALHFWYADAQSAITQGPMSVDNDRYSMTFSGPGDIIGTKATVNFRVELLKKSENLYTWSLSAQRAGAWKKLFALDYVRAT